MIWSVVLTHGESFNINRLSPRGEILRISQILLDPDIGGEGTVYVSYEDSNLVLANLGNFRTGANICLFFQTDSETVLTLIGNCVVTILGYFEPSVAVASPEVYKSSPAKAPNHAKPPRQAVEDSTSEEIVMPKKKAI
jgi:hypothetical protein